MSKPIVNERVEEWYVSISIFGVRRFVSLLERQEMAALGLIDEPMYCQENAIDYLNIPIPEEDICASMRQIGDLLSRVFSDIKQGVTTVIHCENGVERTAPAAYTYWQNKAYHTSKRRRKLLIFVVWKFPVNS